MHRLKKLPQNEKEKFWVYLLGYFWKLFPTKNGLMKLIGICTQEEEQNNILSFFYFFYKLMNRYLAFQSIAQ